MFVTNTKTKSQYSNGVPRQPHPKNVLQGVYVARGEQAAMHTRALDRKRQGTSFKTFQKKYPHPGGENCKWSCFLNNLCAFQAFGKEGIDRMSAARTRWKLTQSKISHRHVYNSLRSSFSCPLLGFRLRAARLPVTAYMQGYQSGHPTRTRE